MSNPDRLLSATQKNNPTEIRRLILEEGVSPSHANGVGQSALHVAALWGHVPALRALISLGAQLDIQNRITGGTPLHCLAASTKNPIINRMECARLLIEAGADPTVQDRYGGVPSDYVEETDVAEPDLIASFPDLKHQRLKQILLNAMPKIVIFDYIEECNVTEVANILENEYRHSDIILNDVKDNNGNSILFATLQKILTRSNEAEEKELDSATNLLQILDLILSEAKLNVNSTDKEGNSAIHLVCQSLYDCFSSNNLNESNVRLLENTLTTLLQHGATVSKSTSLLLHDASRRENIPMMKFLINIVGVNKDMKGRQGLTPLHFASRSGRLEAVTFLIKSGANLNVRDDRGKTPLDAASVNEKVDVINILKENGAENDTDIDKS